METHQVHTGTRNPNKKQPSSKSEGEGDKVTNFAHARKYITENYGSHDQGVENGNIRDSKHFFMFWKGIFQVADPLIKAGFLLTSSDFSDVSFFVGFGNDEEPAIQFDLHKFQLVTSSPVFHAMFNGSLPECDTVRVPDVNPTAFELMIEYIYCGLMPSVLPTDLGLAILYVARKYLLERFEKMVLHILSESDSITDSSVLPLFQASLLYDLQDLKDLTLKYINTNIQILVTLQEFNDLPLDTMLKILQSDDLQISEINLFNAILKWSGVQNGTSLQPGSPSHDLLTACFPYIRFPTMSASEFADGPSQFMNKEDIGTILLHICATGQKPDCQFNTLQRNNEFKFPVSREIPSACCECFVNRRHCLFCLSPIVNLDSAEGVGQCQRSPFRSTSCETPPCYCPCRTAGSCCWQLLQRLVKDQMERNESIDIRPTSRRNTPQPPRNPPGPPRNLPRNLPPQPPRRPRSSVNRGNPIWR